jgi:hypothetical protein
MVFIQRFMKIVKKICIPQASWIDGWPADIFMKIAAFWDVTPCR